jgi:hypothetical protein
LSKEFHPSEFHPSFKLDNFVKSPQDPLSLDGRGVGVRVNKLTFHEIVKLDLRLF